MKAEVILLIVAISIMFLIAIIFAIYFMFRKKESNFEVIDDKLRIGSILVEFRNNPILEVYNENKCSRNYMILTKTTKYKIKPGNKEFKEEIYTKITRIEYYQRSK